MLDDCGRDITALAKSLYIIPTRDREKLTTEVATVLDHAGNQTLEGDTCGDRLQKVSISALVTCPIPLSPFMVTLGCILLKR